MSVSTLKSQRRIVLPKDVCESLNIKEGDDVSFTIEDGCVRVENKKDIVKSLQKMFSHVKTDIVGELIEERRANAKKEQSA